MDKPVCEQLKFKIPPWKHQAEAIERAAGLAYFALFFEMGAGKTSTCINILRWKYAVNRGLLRTLILGPPIILENWKKEILMHSNIPAEDIVVAYGDGSTKKKLDSVLSCFGMHGEPVSKILITNYQTLLNENIMKFLVEWGPEVVVCDESHRLKNRSSKTTKNSLKLADLARHRYILTGTPILNSPMDLYAQFRVLDRGALFGTNFFAFRNRFMEDKNSGMPSGRYFPKWEIKPGALEALSEAIKPVSARVKKQDCLDLPPLVRQVVYIKLPAPQRKFYDEMKKNFITFVQEQAVTAELAITKALRLQQIASGYLKTEDGEEITIKDNPRKDALRDLLDDIVLESGQKVLVWACFSENYKQIQEVCEKLKIEYVEVHGEVSAKARFEAVEKFNTDPQVKVFIGHPGSGGIGINLVQASYSIFYSRNFSLENDLQAESRNHRGGSEIHSKITRIDIVAQDTIDEIIQKKLETKEAISEHVLRGIATQLKGKDDGKLV